MPIHPSMKDLYPPDWPEISQRIRFQRARGCCEWCGVAHDRLHPETGSRVILATAHLDHNPANNSESNLAALCQKKIRSSLSPGAGPHGRPSTDVSPATD